MDEEYPLLSNASTLEEPLKPSVDVNHTHLLINGQFVDAASVNAT